MDKLLTVNVLRRIDAACDDFEAAWRGGSRPRIEDYLLRLAADERDLLVESLRQLQEELERERVEDRGHEAASRLDSHNSNVVLKVIAGPHEGQEFVYEGHDTLLVGRSAAAKLQLKDDPHFSRHHFRLEFNPPECYLLDLQSRNGTFVNGQRVTGRFLNDGDVISGGGTRMAVAIHVSQTPGNSPGTAAQRLASTPSAAGEPLHIAGYEIHEKIGMGELGVVYRATQSSTREVCALKTINAGVRMDDQAIQAFLRETRPLAEMQHPHIARRVETGVSGQMLFVCSEYVAATPWRELSVGWPAAERVRNACAVMAQVLEALEYAHSRGIVHRDVQPGNILVARSSDGLVAKLADFGLAMQHAAAGMSRITREQDAVHALPFMSPEQFINSRAAHPACDIYSVGATLYWMIAGVGPIAVDNSPRRFLAILEDPPVPLWERCPEVPEALARVVHRALEKSPEKRFRSAAEMRQELQPFGAEGR